MTCSKEPGWSVHLTIPLVPVSNNKLLRMHWRDRRRLNRQWLDEIWVALHQARVKGRPELDRVRIRIEIQRPRRRRDDDNTRGGLKPVLDAMVKLGLLADDSTEVIDSLEVMEVNCADSDPRHTVIKVTQIH